MTAPNDDRFGSSEEYRRLVDVYQSAGLSVSDDTIDKIGDVYQSAEISVSDDAIDKIGDQEEFADLIRRIKESIKESIKEKIRRQFEIWGKRASTVNDGEIRMKRALKNLPFQEPQSPSPLSALRPQPTPPSRFGRFANKRRKKTVASSKIRKPELSFKRRPPVKRRTNGR